MSSTKTKYKLTPKPKTKSRTARKYAIASIIGAAGLAVSGVALKSYLQRPVGPGPVVKQNPQTSFMYAEPSKITPPPSPAIGITAQSPTFGPLHFGPVHPTHTWDRCVNSVSATSLSGWSAPEVAAEGANSLTLYQPNTDLTNVCRSSKILNQAKQIAYAHRAEGGTPQTLFQNPDTLQNLGFLMTEATKHSKYPVKTLLDLNVHTGNLRFAINRDTSADKAVSINVFGLGSAALTTDQMTMFLKSLFQYVTILFLFASMLVFLFLIASNFHVYKITEPWYRSLASVADLVSTTTDYLGRKLT